MTGESAAPRNNPWRHRPKTAPIPPEQAARQGEITSLAFLLLGREQAIDFLNREHPGLGARPLALATASDAGRDGVEAELVRMKFRPAAPD